MAEADLVSYISVLIPAAFLGVTLYWIRENRKLKENRKNKEYVKTPLFSDVEKRNFKRGIPVGLGLGILVYLPHIVVIFGGETQWFFIFIQSYPLILYLTFLFFYAGLKFVAAFTNIPILEKKRGYVDGIFASFVIIQIIVFIQFPSSFIPRI